MKTLKELDLKPGDVVKSECGTEFTITMVDDDCTHSRANLVFDKPCLAAMSKDGLDHQEVHASCVEQWEVVSRAPVMKIEVGKYYRTRDGRKMGPVGLYGRGLLDDPTGSVDRGAWWNSDGTKGGASPYHPLDLIIEWPPTWAEMTDEEKGALLLARHEGAVIEFSAGGVEWSLCVTIGQGNCYYRIKPEPTPEPISLDWSALNPEYKWAAVDEDGDVYAYTSKPALNTAFHDWGGVGVEISHLSSYIRGTVEWQHSLIERPSDV